MYFQHRSSYKLNLDEIIQKETKVTSTIPINCSTEHIINKLYNYDYITICGPSISYDDEKTFSYNHGNTKSNDQLEMNEYERKMLLKSIIYDNFVILDSPHNLVYKTSWLYRIAQSFINYHLYHNRLFKNKSFKCNTYLSFLCKLEEYAPSKTFSKKDKPIFQNGEILNDDYKAVNRFLKKQTIDIYKLANIKGIRFSAQGIEYRQDKLSTQTNPSVNLSNLKENWNNKLSYSSWFKVNKELYVTYKELFKSEEMKSCFIYGDFDCDVYGQFNFFFRLTNSDDSLISDKLYASANIRRTINHNDSKFQDKTEGLHHLSIIELGSKQCYNHNMIFVSDKLIHSSPILILPIEANYTFNIIKAIKPSLVKKDENVKFWNLDRFKKHYVKELDKATHLIMIDFERNRMNSFVTYTEDDDDFND
jgi:hypothetical protein